jgi:hypothetical protein
VLQVTFQNISDVTLEQIREAAADDPEMSVLRQYVRDGWPADNRHIDVRARPYSQFRDEIVEEDGILCRGTRVIIPQVLRRMMIERTHSAYLGADSCLRRARQCIYYPGMNNDLRVFISQCVPCNQYGKKQPYESLRQHEVPSLPFSKIALDTFHYGGAEHLITVDYYSNFFEVDKLQTATSKEVIHKLKIHFSRNGIPVTVMSDGGPAFKSAEFKSFAREWSFAHVISSPGNSRSNGKAEAAVKIAKNILRKCKSSNTDPYIALLEYRNTPLQGLQYSPAQLLFSRATRSTLPSSTNLLTPTVVPRDQVDSRRKQSQHRQAEYHDKSAHDLSVLKPGDSVRIQPSDKFDKVWKKGVVTGQQRDRTYEVLCGDKTFQRNRRFLRPTNDREVVVIDEENPDRQDDNRVQKPSVSNPSESVVKPAVTVTDSRADSVVKPKSAPKVRPKRDNVPTAQPVKSSLKPSYVTSRGRTIKPPVRFADA